MPLIVTITGIRPDFIRMSPVFEKLDHAFDHVMIHTGQHYEDALSKLFFKDLVIRKPDYTLETGLTSRNHYEQLSYLSVNIIDLLHREKLKPDIILFLGDSNTVLASVPLFKEGFKIGHIEGGMRSYDLRMPEEVNRHCCDYVSDLVFVYTPLYKERLVKENKDPNGIFVIGNTITELVRKYMPRGERKGDYFVADIHRNENLKTPWQYEHILTFLDELGRRNNKPVKLVRFSRAVKMINENGLLEGKDFVELVGPVGFIEFLEMQYQSDGVISDSGTAQEECPLLGVPVVVPRDFTERPESIDNGNSILIGEKAPIAEMVDKTMDFFANYKVSEADTAWLGDGKAAEKITQILKEEL